ncbi:protein TIFY 5A-like [Olea europaea var. sylvestris]|uniref:Protein TIFY n=2 Tax=Olea europaea subsp. europaea TaxID=158383 RepID=A0A8S0S7J6_OLEEU|nr:protein TIFY 5A-like [Olea europaea var. sylvestris]CAA2988221.1 TIFY 5A-like [Olea europaea subsp. europaea]
MNFHQSLDIFYLSLPPSKTDKVTQLQLIIEGMSRNCNLKLRHVASASSNSTDYNHPKFEMSGNSNEKNQTLTIFYNGRMTAADVTEVQARAIISLASRETEKKSNANKPPSSGPSSLLSHIYNPTGTSMKRSLQQFLQKRKTRARKAFPYHH